MGGKKLIDKYLQRAVTINRVSDSEAAKVTSALRTLNQGLEAAILKQAANLTGDKVNRLSRQIDTAIADKYNDEILVGVNDVINEVGKRESSWNFRTLQEFAADEIDLIDVDKDLVVRSAKSKPYQGRTFDAWFVDLGAAESQRLNSAITTAWVDQLTVDELADMLGSILTRSQNDLKTLTRSYIHHTAVEARRAILAANDDIHDGVIWISTLDHRTTPLICGIRDLAEYDKDRQPVGHDLPWEGGPGRVHFNCRSIEVPKIRGVKFSGKRSSIGAGRNYEAGDDTNTRGKVRKPTKAKRKDGTFKVKLVDSDTKYEAWLRTQPEDFVSDVLGNKESGSAFKDGARLKSFLPETGPGSIGSITNQSVLNL